MSTTRKIAAGAVIGVLTILAGTAFALSNISLTLGSLPGSYDFGTVNLTTGGIDPVGTKPATVQVHTFTVKPGETLNWHYHRALAYVVIEHGTLSEQHINADGTCSAWVAFGVGSAFVEEPGDVHRVANTGKSEAVVTWATAFPTEDGVFRILPQFTVGGVYPPPNPPSCH
jgi:quercetin dioxygenase-like cupin family protein